jgi:hypothetical protein
MALDRTFGVFNVFLVKPLGSWLDAKSVGFSDSLLGICYLYDYLLIYFFVVK